MESNLLRLMQFIKESYGIELGWVSNESSLSDFPVYDGAQRKLSAKLGFELKGDELLRDIVVRM